MSVKVHEPVCLDSAQDLYFWFDHFLGDQVKDEWAVGGTGSAVVVDAQAGGIVRLTTGATSGNASSLFWGNIRSLHVDKRVTMEVRAKANQTTYITIDIALFFGFSDRIFFEVSESVGGAVDWKILCQNGGVLTNLTAGVALDTDYHIFRIECFPTGQVHFYIDGVETINSPITTNIPDDAADFLQPLLFLVTNEDAAKSMDVDYVVVRQER